MSLNQRKADFYTIFIRRKPVFTQLVLIPQETPVAGKKRPD
jgi:hypothetical protein